MPYTTPTPSTVGPGDTFPATAYNIIAGDLADHETRIKTGVESYTTAQKTALTGVTTGTVIYDSTLGVIQTWNGSAWKTLIERTLPPMALMILATSQSVANATDTTLASATFAFDTDNMGGTPNRITISTSGTYLVSYNMAFLANATGYRNAIVSLSGLGNAVTLSGAAVAPTSLPGNATVNTTLANTMLVVLNQGDYLSLKTAQSSGGALLTTATQAYLQAVLVGKRPY